MACGWGPGANCLDSAGFEVAEDRSGLVHRLKQGVVMRRLGRQSAPIAVLSAFALVWPLHAPGHAAAARRSSVVTQTASPVGESGSASGDGIDPPAGWRDAPPGAYIKVSLHAVDPSRPSWAKPIDLYFRRTASGWQLVGVERSIT